VSLATVYLHEGALTLRRASAISDPYLRADAVWRATLGLRCAGERLWGWRAETCDEIAGKLEVSCEAGAEPPDSLTLYRYARRLERAVTR
jgi:hypothetical protein